jgi:branched-chain amino acid transport system permease protein
MGRPEAVAPSFNEPVIPGRRASAGPGIQPQRETLQSFWIPGSLAMLAPRNDLLRDLRPLLTRKIGVIMLPPVFGVLFDGLAYGMLLFLLSVGLSVTLGLMNFVNLAHCAFAMLGGYVTVVLMKDLHWNFFATLPVAFFAAALVSIVIERILYRRLYRASDLDQVLLTIGLAFISVATAAWFFGTTQQPIDMPSYMRGSFVVMGLNIAVYRLFLVAVGIVVTILLIMTVEHTRFGAQVRAAVDNQRMARGLGIDVDRTFAITFALGSGLAGLGGALAIEIVGLDPSFAFTYLVYVLIIVSVGGLGSIGGSFAAACLIGVSDIAGKYYVPQLGAFLIYLVMVAILMWRPAGLFGRR